MGSPGTTTREHVYYYIASADNANKFLTPGGVSRDNAEPFLAQGREFSSYQAALDWLDQECSTLIDIARDANEVGEYQVAAIIPNLLWSYFNLTKRWTDWLDCTSSGLAAARSSGDRNSETYLLMSQGVAFTNLRQTEQAIASLRESIRLLHQIDDEIGLGYALQNLANAQAQAGLLPEALMNFQEALKLFNSHERGKAIVLISMSMAFNSVGRYAEAKASAEEAYAIARSQGNQQAEASSLHSIGVASAGLTHTSDAASFYREALRIRRLINDKHGVAVTLHELGKIHKEFDNSTEARACWEKSLQILSELGSPKSAEVAASIDALTSIQGG